MDFEPLAILTLIGDLTVRLAAEKQRADQAEEAFDRLSRQFQELGESAVIDVPEESVTES